MSICHRGNRFHSVRFSRFGFSCLGQVQLAEAPVRVTGVRGRRPFGGLLADAEEGQPRDPGRSGAIRGCVGAAPVLLGENFWAFWRKTRRFLSSSFFWGGRERTLAPLGWRNSRWRCYLFFPHSYPIFGLAIWNSGRFLGVAFREEPPFGWFSKGNQTKSSFGGPRFYNTPMCTPKSSAKWKAIIYLSSGIAPDIQRRPSCTRA